MIDYLSMKMNEKKQKNLKNNPDFYEDRIRLENLDPYEALIKSNNLLNKNNELFE